MVRNDHELRAEAMEFHERYPYAVLVALLFMPIDSCDDGDTDKFLLRPRRDDVSQPSWTSPVQTNRRRCSKLFYIGLYEWEGKNVGPLQFFDVMEAPPKRGVPKRLVGLEDVIRRIVEVYGLRNRKYIPWEEDLEEATGSVPDLSPSPEEAEDAQDAMDDTGDQGGDD